MIKKKSETIPLNHDLFPVSGEQVELGFSGDQISNDSGLLLLLEVENQDSYAREPEVIIIDYNDTNNNTYGQHFKIKND